MSNGSYRLRRRRLPGAILLIPLAGCLGPAYRNTELATYDSSGGYRFEALTPGEGNTDATFVCLTFSGGGMRAAALAYGVLEELHATRIGEVEEANHLGREIDVISGVSGGAFSAMAYGLWRERIFDGRFERRFLKHNVQGDLLLKFWHPKYLFRLLSLMFDRIDMAAYYYDEEVFERRTYADLLSLGTRPLIVVNATNVAAGQRFEFTQGDFDLLGSDLSTLPVGWAVAASSAFPLLLSPLRLRYYPGASASAALREVLSSGPGAGGEARRRQWAESLVPEVAVDEPPRFEIDADEHKYLYLLDGGLADNLGLSRVLESYQSGPIRRAMDAGRIERLVVIIVDARTEPPEHLERRATAPGLFTVGLKTGTTAMNRHSATLTNITRFLLSEQPRRFRRLHARQEAALRAACPEVVPLPPLPEHRVESYVIEVKFHDIPDARERRTFLSILTNLFLPSRQVEELIAMGRRLLREDPEFQRLLRDLNAAPGITP